MPIDSFLEMLVDEIDGKIRYATLGFAQGGRMVLGGSGGPPGGFIGKLAQKYVTYDTAEEELNTTSGTPSLVDNLNHIRYRVNELEENPVINDFVDLSDTPTTYSGAAGRSVVVNSAEDGLEFTTVSGETTFLGLTDTPNSFTTLSGAIPSVSNSEDSIVFSGEYARLLYDELQLNDSLNDFVFSRPITESGSVPNVVFQLPYTSDNRGNIIFRALANDVPIDRDITFDNASVGSFNGTGTLSHTVGNYSNRILVVGVATRGARSVTALTYGGVALTYAGYNQQGSDARSEIWYLLDPAVGTANISVTISSADNSVISAVSLYNVGAVGSFGGSSGGPVTSLTTSLPATEGQWIVDCLSMQGNTTPTTSGNTEQTQRASLGINFAGLGMSTIVGATDSDSVWSFDSQYYAFSYLYLDKVSGTEAAVETDILTVTDTGILVTSSGVVTNLNANYLQGNLAADFLTEDPIFIVGTDVGIGEESPSSKLDVNGTGTFGTGDEDSVGVAVKEGSLLQIGESVYPTKSSIAFGDGYNYIYEKFDDAFAMSAGNVPNWTSPLGEGYGDILVAGWDSGYNNVEAHFGDIDSQDHGHYLSITASGFSTNANLGVNTRYPRAALDVIGNVLISGELETTNLNIVNKAKKVDHNNWASLSDVVQALVDLGLFDEI